MRGQRFRSSLRAERIALFCAMILLVRSDLSALGERQNARGVGMGGAAVALATGLDAAGTNPANLALGEPYRLMVGIAPAGFHAGGDVLSYGIYTEYFTGMESSEGVVGKVVSEEDKSMILDRFEGRSIGTSRAELDSRLIGISVSLPQAGVLAFTVTDYAGGRMEYPDDLAKFLLYGNPLGSDYDLEGTRLTAAWMRSYALSYGAKLMDLPTGEWLAVGGAVKLVHGFAYYEVLRSNSRIVTSDQGVLTGDIHFLARSSESSTLKEDGFDLFPAPSGTGFGFDLGISAGLSSVVSVGLSLTDIGSVAWSGNTQEKFTDTLLTIDNPLDPGQQGAVVNAISGLRDREAEPFSSALPTRVRAGVGLQLHRMAPFLGVGRPLLLALEYARGFRDVPGVSTASRLALGLEFAGTDWLAVRSGIWSLDPVGTHVSFGIGIRAGIIALDAGTDNIVWAIAPGRTSYGSMSLGVTLQL